MFQSNVPTSEEGPVSWHPAHQSRSARQSTLNTDHKYETFERRDMFEGQSCSPRKGQDLVCTPAALWIWGLPLGLVIFATNVWHGYQLPATMTGILVTLATAWIGVACYVNGRLCGRTHCKIDGILLPLLSLVGVLNLLGVTAFSWHAYSDALWIILLISFVPECFGLIHMKAGEP
jgi:hypothetical protein